MTNETVSPAVMAFQQERRRAAENPSAMIDEGLEETFPASDPPAFSSAVVASAPAAAIPDYPTASAGPLGSETAPLVDEALDSLRARREDTAWGRDDIAALREEVALLRDQAAGIGEQARARVSEELSRSRSIIRDRPLASVAVAAALGFMFGMTR